MKRALMCCLGLLWVAACSDPSRMPPAAGEAFADSGEAVAADDPAAQITAASPRKLVKTVHLVLQVDDAEASADASREIAAAVGGFVSALSSERHQDLVYVRMTLRVPVERLDESVERLKDLAERVDKEQIETEDVTDRFVDLEARLRTLNATETELQALLAESRQRGNKVKDIMAVYEELTEIRTAIEQIQGRINALGNLAALSTIHLRFVPTEAAKPLVVEGWRPWQTVRRSARTLVGFLQGLADFVIFLAVFALPFALVVGLPLWGLYRVWRRWRGRPRAVGPAPRVAED